ncbi:MAG: Cof-type HAD-IIB family hydrolase [Sporolactobacillus sp.]
MSQVKIVFFDIDSTLYDQNKSVPESTAEAVRALQKKGIKTVIATGRAPFMFKELRKELDIHSYISFNGSYVVSEDQAISKRPLPEDVLSKLENAVQAHNHRLVFVNEEGMKIDGKLDPTVEAAIDSLKLRLPYPEIDADYYRKREIYQGLLFYSDQEDCSYLKRKPLDSLEYVRWHPLAVDVIPQNGSKAYGVKKMLEILHLSPDQACAFGDGNNDVEMLGYVGTGVAMGNAVDAAKEAAGLVTRPVDQEGIYYGLKKIGLI